MSGYEDYHAQRRGDIASFRADRLHAFFEDLDLAGAVNTSGVEWIEIGPAKVPGIRVTMRDGTRFDLHITQIERP